MTQQRLFTKVEQDAVRPHVQHPNPHDQYVLKRNMQTELAAHGVSVYDPLGAAAAAQVAAIAASQPLDADLTAIAGLTSAANKGIQFTGTHTAATYDLTAAGKALLDDADAAAQRATLGLGTAALNNTGDFDAAGAAAAAQAASQPLDAELTAIAGLSSAANKAPYFTGSGAAALADLSSAGRALIDDATAADQRTTLGLGTAALNNTGDFDAAGAAAAVLATSAQKASNLGDLTNSATARANLGAAALAGLSTQDFSAKIVTATGLVDASGASAGQIKFPSTQNASADPNTLDDYEEYAAASTACTGAITAACVWKLTKIGNVVTLTLPAVQGAATAINYITIGLAVPARFRPAADVGFCSVPILDNATRRAQPGLVRIPSGTGVITLFVDPSTGTNYTASANAAGLADATAVSWTL